jgi:hypothetical protein
MTHFCLVSHLYANFSHFRTQWEEKWEATQEFGAFVFLPGKELQCVWWTLPQIRQYIRDGCLNDEEMLDGIYEFEFGEDFLVLVIEFVDGPRSQNAYFHRMNKTMMN